jgi:hypothetical protein
MQCNGGAYLRGDTRLGFLCKITGLQGGQETTMKVVATRRRRRRRRSSSGSSGDEQF